MGVGVSTTAVANPWLDTLPSTVHWQQHVGDPGDGTQNPSLTTTRQPVPLGAASGGAKAMTGTPPVQTMVANETITHGSFWSSPTGGTCLFTAQAPVPKTVAAGGTVTLDSLTVSIPATARMS